MWMWMCFVAIAGGLSGGWGGALRGRDAIGEGIGGTEP